MVPPSLTRRDHPLRVHRAVVGSGQFEQTDLMQLMWGNGSWQRQPIDCAHSTMSVYVLQDRDHDEIESPLECGAVKKVLTHRLSRSLRIPRHCADPPD